MKIIRKHNSWNAQCNTIISSDDDINVVSLSGLPGQELAKKMLEISIWLENIPLSKYTLEILGKILIEEIK